MILESIVTSVDREGRVNIAPMGPRVDAVQTWSDPQGQSIVLRPFDSSRTYRNLVDTGKAVIHVTDDVELFAKAAVDALSPQQAAELVQPLDDPDWRPLRDCHRWFAVAVESVSDDRPRIEMRCRIVEAKLVRPFFGFNRAKHAVIEAAILATRTQLLPPGEILSEIDRLRPLIDKTGGPAEHSAFDFLCETIDDRIASR